MQASLKPDLRRMSKPGIACPDPVSADRSAGLATGAAPAWSRASVLPAATLDDLATGVPAVVRDVTAPAAAPEWARWLDEIGFLPGERVMVMARSVPGGDPLVVRIGNSTFALRRAEAACMPARAGAP